MRVCIVGRQLPKLDMGFRLVEEHYELLLGVHTFLLAPQPETAMRLQFDFLLWHGLARTELYERFRNKRCLVILTAGAADAVAESDAAVIPNRASVTSLLQLKWEAVPQDFVGKAQELVNILLPEQAQVA